jgi:hypothetical protein
MFGRAPTILMIRKRLLLLGRGMVWPEEEAVSSKQTKENTLVVVGYGLRPRTFAPLRTWVPHISLVFGEMWDSTALTLKLFIPNQQLRSTSVSPTSRQKRARYGAPMFVVRQGL